MAAAAWSRSVDLPIPGSPESSTAEPCAKPSPAARSSSPIPETMRCSGGSSEERLSIAAALALRRALRPAGPARLGAEPSWLRLFHAPQAGHLPCHLVE